MCLHFLCTRSLSAWAYSKHEYSCCKTQFTHSCCHWRPYGTSSGQANMHSAEPHKTLMQPGGLRSMKLDMLSMIGSDPIWSDGLWHCGPSVFFLFCPWQLQKSTLARLTHTIIVHHVHHALHGQCSFLLLWEKGKNFNNPLYSLLKITCPSHVKYQAHSYFLFSPHFVVATNFNKVQSLQSWKCIKLKLNIERWRFVHSIHYISAANQPL